MNDFFDSNLDQLDRFSDEAREKLRSLSEEIEREVTRSLQLLQKLEQLQGTMNGAPLEASGFADFRSVGSANGDFLSGALDSAIARAANNVLRTGKVNGRSILRSGASAIGTALGQAVTGGGMRLSVTQTALELSRQLTRGSRNS